MTAASLLLRADAGVTMGTGHAMRCLALAQAWQDAGGRAHFVMAETTPAIKNRLLAESVQVESISCIPGTADDSRHTIALAKQQNAVWIAVDGYQFSADYQRALKAARYKVLFLDDYGHAPRYSADLVLNQNVSAARSLYADREPGTRLLLGPRYCLLRREFSGWRDWKREISPQCHRLLVTMGGSDPDNFTARIIESLPLAGIDDLEATIVIGGSNPHFGMLKEMAARSGRKLTIRNDVTNMAELMAAADVAISSAGSTCWEFCLLGLPALLIDVSANQTPLAKELGRSGCAIHVGDRTVSLQAIAAQLRRLAGSAELRQSLSRRSRELVDGGGASRVVTVLCGGSNLFLRSAEERDRRLLWEWANDPDVRAASFSAQPIPWETHVAWFEEKLHQDECRILIAEDDEGAPVGQIRFNSRADGDCDTDVSLAREWRRRGLAAPLIRQGAESATNAGRCARLHAFVKPENVASVRAFESAGFKRFGIDHVRGKDAVHLIYQSKSEAK